MAVKKKDLETLNVALSKTEEKQLKEGITHANSVSQEPVNVKPISTIEQFAVQLDILQQSNLKVEARQTFTKQEIMAIVTSILK